MKFRKKVLDLIQSPRDYDGSHRHEEQDKELADAEKRLAALEKVVGSIEMRRGSAT